MLRPLRAEDALFLHAQTPLACQQAGPAGVATMT